MKRLFILAIPVFLILVISLNYSCRTSKNRENTPESVATRFLQHLGKFEFDEARLLGTEKTNRMIDMLEVLMDLSKEKGGDTVLVKKDINVEIEKVAVDGQVAVVTFKNEEGKSQTIDLVKEKGKWLVDMKKETPNLNGLPGNNKKEEPKQ
jgi:hypothetical protein